MNPKTLGTYIAKTRADIAAHIGRLSGIEQHPIKFLASANDPSNTVANILDATLSAQLSNAMERLRALNDPDMENRAPESAQDLRSEAGVVDLGTADYKVIDK